MDISFSLVPDSVECAVVLARKSDYHLHVDVALSKIPIYFTSQTILSPLFPPKERKLES